MKKPVSVSLKTGNNQCCGANLKLVQNMFDLQLRRFSITNKLKLMLI